MRRLAGRREIRSRRSCLTVPASNQRFVTKATEIEVDEVVLDLEDSVPPDEKSERTRLRLAAAIGEHGWHSPTVALRINATSTHHCLLDLVTIVPLCKRNLHCVVIPKVEDPFDVMFVERVLVMLEDQYDLGYEVGIEVLIETAAGLARCTEIAAASARVEALIFGPADFAASIGTPTLSIGSYASSVAADADQAPAVVALCQILTAARAAGIQAIDGPFGSLEDSEGLVASAKRSASFGYDGKWAIHPSQIEPLNEIFTPSAAHVRQAEHIVNEYRRISQSGQGAGRLSGELIDEASVRLATNVLRRVQEGDNPQPCG